MDLQLELSFLLAIIIALYASFFLRKKWSTVKKERVPDYSFVTKCNTACQIGFSFIVFLAWLIFLMEQTSPSAERTLLVIIYPLLVTVGIIFIHTRIKLNNPINA